MTLRETLIVAGSFLVLGSCATMLTPVNDPTLPPAPSGVYTLDHTSCGNEGATTACIFKWGDTLSGEIGVHIPRTNTTGKAATLHLVSPECSIDITQSGIPGQTLVFKLPDLLGAKPITYSCSIQLVLEPVWDGEDSFTFPVYPLEGRVLVLTFKGTPAKIDGGQIFNTPGFYEMGTVAPGKDSSEAINTVGVETGGSALGQILYDGCGLPPTAQPYSAINPSFDIPHPNTSCILFGEVQRADVAGSLYFAVAVDVWPPSYQPLPPPVFAAAGFGSTDPAVSAVDYGSGVDPGGNFRIPKEISATEYTMWLITTAGRMSVARVKNSAIIWSMP